jgi:DNA topoisomerase I
MARLLRSDLSERGVSRRRCGRGFRYSCTSGEKVADAATLDRIRALVLPPAWTDVWICPWPHGHIQAVWTDAAGRRQWTATARRAGAEKAVVAMPDEPAADLAA